MKIVFVFIGKTTEPYIEVGIETYIKKIKSYLPVEVQIIPAIKDAGNLSKEELKRKEGEKLLEKLDSMGNTIYILDEKGKQFTSRGFADFIQKQMNEGNKSLVLVVGGAFGFSEEVYKKAKGKISLSTLTFSHQMVRLFLAEQVYRAISILNNSPYHHD